MKKLPAFQSPLPPSQGSVIIFDTPSTTPGCISGVHVKQQQRIIVGGLYEIW